MRQKGPEPNVITCNAAISACEKGKQPDKGLELLEETQGKGMEPGSITYNAASQVQMAHSRG